MRKIILYAKYISAIGGALAVIYGGLVFLHKTANHLEQQTEVMTTVQQQQTIILDSIYSLSRQVGEVKVELSGVKENMYLMGNAYNGLKNSYIKYLSNDKALTKQEFLDYMNEMEKKSSGKTLYDPFGYLIPLSLKLE